MRCLRLVLYVALLLGNVGPAWGQPAPTADDLTLRPGDRIVWSAGPTGMSHSVRFGGGGLVSFAAISEVLELEPSVTASPDGTLAETSAATNGTLLEAVVKDIPDGTTVEIDFSCGVHFQQMKSMKFRVSEDVGSTRPPREVRISASDTGLNWVLETAAGSVIIDAGSAPVEPELPEQQPASETHVIAAVTNGTGVYWVPSTQSVQVGDEIAWVNQSGYHSLDFTDWASVKHRLEVISSDVNFSTETGKSNGTAVSGAVLLRARLLEPEPTTSAPIAFYCGQHGLSMSGTLTFGAAETERPSLGTENVASIYAPRGPSTANIGTFEEVEIGTRPKDSYFVLVADVNADGRPDVVTSGLGRPGTEKTEELSEIFWLENPTWRKHVIGNFDVPVALAAADIDYDGDVDIAMSYEYGECIFKCKPDNGTIGWLQNPGAHAIDANWTLYPIGELLATHRLAFGHFSDPERLQLLAVPVVGGAGGDVNAPIDVTLYSRPDDLTGASEWPKEVVDRSLSVIHELASGQFDLGAGSILDSAIMASREGLTHLSKANGGAWTVRLIGAGDRSQVSTALPQKWTGSGSVAVGRAPGGPLSFIVATEPFHGNFLSVYRREQTSLFTNEWSRCIVDHYDELSNGGQGPGHDVAVLDVDGDGIDEFAVGLRGPGRFGGVFLYSIRNLDTCEFDRQRLSGISAGQIEAADIDGDDRPDLVTIPYRVLTYFESEDTEIMLYLNRTSHPSLHAE